jgi:hypothetical protein
MTDDLKTVRLGSQPDAEVVANVMHVYLLPVAGCIEPTEARQKHLWDPFQVDGLLQEQHPFAFIDRLELRISSSRARFNAGTKLPITHRTTDLLFSAWPKPASYVSESSRSGRPFTHRYQTIRVDMLLATV